MTTLTKKKLKTKIRLSSTVHIPVKSLEGNRQTKEEYVLVSVLNHIGSSAYSGHYICEAMDWSSGLWWKFNDANVTLLGEGPRHLAEDDRNDANDAGNDANGVTDRDDEEGDEKDSDDEEFQPTNGGGKRKGAKKGKGNAKKKQKTTSSKAKPTAADTMRKGKGKKGSKETRKGSIKGNGSGKGKVILGSEEAYVLMYVCKDYLLKHARLVTSRDPSMLPSESSRSLVAGENIELRRGDDRVRQKVCVCVRAREIYDDAPTESKANHRNVS